MKIKKILVSQPRPSSEKSPYFDLEKKYEVEIDFRPFIKVEGLTSREFRQTKVSIADHTAVIFTARTAVDHYFRLCKELRFKVPDTMKYFCISETVAHYLQKYIIYRKRKIFYSETGKFDNLMPAMEKHIKERYLFPMSDVHDDQSTTILDEHHINYKTAVMYRTVSNRFAPDEPFDYDMLIFFTPSGIKSLLSNFPDFEQGEIAIGGMGSKTVEEIKNAGLRLDVALGPKAPSMPAAIDLYLEKNAKLEAKREREEAKLATTDVKKQAELAKKRSLAAKKAAATRKKMAEAKKKAEAAEAKRKAEEAKQAEANRIVDEAARQAELAIKRSLASKKAAATRKRMAEEKRKAEEAEAARQAELALKRSLASKKAAATRKRMAEEKRKAEEAEAARQAELALKRSLASKKAAATRKRMAEEKRKAEATKQSAAKKAAKK